MKGGSFCIEDFLIDPESYFEGFTVSRRYERQECLKMVGKLKRTEQGVKIYKRPFHLEQSFIQKFQWLYNGFEEGVYLADNIFLVDESSSKGKQSSSSSNEQSCFVVVWMWDRTKVLLLCRGAIWEQWQIQNSAESHRRRRDQSEKEERSFH